MTYDCMTPEEYALWADQPDYRYRSAMPCYDCPAWFAREARERGRCEGRPGLGRPPARARARYNVPDEYSVAIAHNAQRPASRLYSEVRGVDIPEYRRND